MGVSSYRGVDAECLERYTHLLIDASPAFPIHFLKIYSGISPRAGQAGAWLGAWEGSPLHRDGEASIPSTQATYPRGHQGSASTVGDGRCGQGRVVEGLGSDLAGDRIMKHGSQNNYSVADEGLLERC